MRPIQGRPPTPSPRPSQGRPPTPRPSQGRPPTPNATARSAEVTTTLKPAGLDLRVARMGRRRAADQVQRFGEEILAARLDAGLSQRRVAAAAGVSTAYLGRIEVGNARPAIDLCGRLAAALGGELTIRFYPGTGPLLRDHLQAAMLQTLLRLVHRRWRRRLEVAVYRPVRGVIDLVLEDATVMVATEVQSDLRRFEQQLRWAKAKADALTLSATDGDALTLSASGGDPFAPSQPAAAGRLTSRLLVLRSTERTRRIVALHPDVFEAAYPAPLGGALAALTSADGQWLGPALLWMRVEHGVATLLDHPPRGIQVGR